MQKTVFQEVRFSLYITLLVNGIFIQWLAPYNYKCDFSDEKCFACGLRTAVDLLLEGKVYEAYQSNKLIVVIVLIAVVMVSDVLIYLFRKMSKRK